MHQPRHEYSVFVYCWWEFAFNVGKMRTFMLFNIYTLQETLFYWDGHATSHVGCPDDQRRVTLIGLLDLSATFDRVDHCLSLQLARSACLERFSDVWHHSSLLEVSNSKSVLFGVPAVRYRPSVFIMYTADLSRMVANYGLSTPTTACLHQ